MDEPTATAPETDAPPSAAEELLEAPGAAAPPEEPTPDPTAGDAVTCKVCGCEFGVNPRTVPAGTRVSCPVCRSPW